MSDHRPAGRPWGRASFALIVGVFVATTLRRLAEAFHPLPFADTWSGEIEFWASGRHRGVGALWAAHNEHRVPWTRLLLWIDVRVFGARQVLLVVGNVAAVALVAAGVGVLAQRVLHESDLAGDPEHRWFVTATAVACTWSWTQMENLVGGFQSTMVLAVAMPLWACILAASADVVDPRRRLRRERAAILVSLMAIGTAASAVVTPFVVAAILWRGRSARRTVAAVVALGSSAAVLYRIGLSSTAVDSPLRSLRNPLTVARYVLVYLGSTPDIATAGRLPGELFGITFVVVAGWLIARWLRRVDRRPYEGAAIGMLIVVLFTALVTALGRIRFGTEQALASRYQSTALCGVALLLVLVLADPPRLFARRRRSVIPLALLLPVGLLPTQLRDVGGVPPSQHRAFLRMSAMALAIGADDPVVLSRAYADVSQLRRVASLAKRRGLTVLADEPYASLRRRIGMQARRPPVVSCASSLTLGSRLADGSYRRVGGRVTIDEGSAPEDPVAVTDRTGAVVGFVVLSVPLSVLPEPVAGGAEAVGVPVFGYVSTRATGPLSVDGPRTACRNGPA